MIGRDESMPNIVREPDMPSEERERVIAIAKFMLNRTLLPPPGVGSLRAAMAISKADFELVMRALIRYVPAGLPESAPHAVAAADDHTARVTPPGLPAAGVICEPVESEASDGIVEPSQDDARTSVAQVDHTAMHRSQDGQAFIVKRGSADRIAIPHIPDDKTRR